MSRQANQSGTWDYNVVQLQLQHPTLHTPIPQFGNFREDTGECLGVTSEKYGLVQNGILLEAAQAALQARGLSGYTQKTVVTGNGSRFFAQFAFANKQLASGVGDVFGYLLTLKNSFDRTLRASFSLGFLRLVCMNGAATLEQEFSVTRKHSAQISVDFVGAAIDKAMEHGQTALRVFDDMAGTPITDEQGVNVLDQLVKSDVLSGSMSASIKTLWLAPRRPEDQARTVYALYNAATEHLTHQVARDRFEYAERVNNNLLLRLVNAARHPDKLARLILPVPGAAIGAPVVTVPAVVS